jgi:hypothetical protein
MKLMLAISRTTSLAFQVLIAKYEEVYTVTFSDSQELQPSRQEAFSYMDPRYWNHV